MIETLVENLISAGVTIKVNEGNLKINAPKGALTPVLKQALKANKQALITYLQQVGQQGGHQAIPQLPQQAFYDLSHAQRRLWVLDQLEASNTAFNMPVSTDFKTVNRPALQKAFLALVQRHEVLRSTFTQQNGQPKQIIHAVKPSFS